MKYLLLPVPALALPTLALAHDTATLHAHTDTPLWIAGLALIGLAALGAAVRRRAERATR